MADTTGRSLTYGEVLTAAVLLGRIGGACFSLPGERSSPEMVGVLLPSTVAGALVNLSLTLRGAVPVNLNFTAGADAMQSAIEQCGISTVITSRAFLAKAKIQPLPGTVYIEDLLKSATPAAKLRAYLAARFAPAALLSPGGRTPDSLAAVIFSSGSTGVPKGVMLSHYNVMSNIDAIAQLFWINSSDRIVGVLPFFHSFGFTVTIWFPLLAGCGVVYHPNPTDARAIGEMVQQHKATLLLTTPTFCGTYIRKCAAEEFASLRYVLVGAEKLRQPIADGFREKFGVPLLEGYGCTEMSPVVAVNVPDFSAGKDTQTGNKAGTVGHPLPGVAARIV
ncbi:MAG TPA: AMP-binding protein, partial [Steroidobacteraceae bacterium]